MQINDVIMNTLDIFQCAQITFVLVQKDWPKKKRMFKCLT